MAHNPLFHQHLAMYFSTLPCPPLPLVVTDDKSACSFDLIAHCLSLAMLADNQSLNRKRKNAQMDCHMELDAALSSQRDDAEEIYGHFLRFTGDYLRAFGEDGARFLPLHTVKLGDPVHRACCEWSAGQDILLLPEERQCTALAYASYSYEDLLRKALSRFKETYESAVEDLTAEVAQCFNDSAVEDLTAEVAQCRLAPEIAAR